jgi:hypothetical protein
MPTGKLTPRKVSVWNENKVIRQAHHTWQQISHQQLLVVQKQFMLFA